MEEPTSRAAEAVQRSLSRRQATAETEVARLIAAGRELFGAGVNPRVADIVTAAEVSIEAFYRYFGSKAEFVAAISEDGIRRVSTYVGHKAASADSPGRRLHAAVTALMSQAATPELASASRNILGSRHEVAISLSFRTEIAEILAPILTDLGSTDVLRDSRLAATTLIGAVEDQVWNATLPTDDDIGHLVGFLRHAIS
ncbi:TetR/AcrR family transcriptional regulator [Gordonia liuliyuniae]|uniref:TetR/AcrR family transcriptional regulator n=1 Tax=Gordonia liuliyuniae TaxID=2911517 RepID=A0ABS9IP30_9ACTN|nr:TetR family transcriptional regulator [Gordonia liuliyuniae]MCF8587326.1 TetR/AcrR family transcriptional regulator [Gordonia liuliyuniae]